jgi:hypothetical protein
MAVPYPPVVTHVLATEMTMSTRRQFVVFLIIAASVLAPGRGALAQTQRFTTPWGHPDLQGVWNNQTPVPFERPKEFGDKAFYTKEEAAEVERSYAKQLVGLFDILDPVFKCDGDAGGCAQSLAVWMDDSKVSPNLRTSLVIDPPDGRIPYTAEGRKRWLSVPSFERELLGQPTEANGPQDRTLIERCLAAGGLIEPNPVFSNYHYILQTPDYVVIVSEELHDHRIIPLDVRPHVGAKIRGWLGDPRGRWEGQTLVVETTNFNDRVLFRGATPQLRLVERFTRRDANTIMYELTVTDPATFTQPWKVENALRRSDAMIYESDCHEGNYALANILRAARTEEKKR